jgi:RNA binding exosome subunit
MTNIVKEYGILKPALMHHRDFRDFMKSLDEVLNEDDIDEVLKRLEEREKMNQ